MVTLYKNTPASENGRDVKNVVENVVENEKLILQELGKNSKISAKGLADIIDLSERTVQRYLKSLQKQNKLKRIGPAKGGHWKIINNEMD